MNAFLLGFARGCVNTPRVPENKEQRGLLPEDRKVSEVSGKILRELHKERIPGLRANAPDGGNENYNPSMSGPDDNSRTREVDWSNVINNGAQGIVNAKCTYDAAKNGDIATFVVSGALAADNLVEVGREFSGPVQNALEVVGNGMNQSDIYWDNLDRK